MADYQYLHNKNLDNALQEYLTRLSDQQWKAEPEWVPVHDALERITAQAAYAMISAPHYSACAMDGIALMAAATFGATDTTPVQLQESLDFVRVDTGDPLPESCDAVVMIEDVVEATDGSIRLFAAATPWQHVRQIGEDICAGEMVLPSHTRIEPAVMGAMLAGGILEVSVLKRCRVGLIPTGDEIVSPTDQPKKGEIIEFNTTIFSGMLAQWGACCTVYKIVPDVYEQIRNSVQTALSECDLVLLNAGSSAGREDFSAGVAAALGELITHGIAIKPGKPTILAFVKGKPLIGLPGYPVSGIIVMEELVKQVLGLFYGCRQPAREEITAVLSRKLVSSLKYQEFVRVKLGKIQNKWVAVPLQRGAGVVTSFVKADGILEIAQNSEGLDTGREVKVRLLRSRNEIENTLVCTGSHDPLIDEIANLMKQKYSRFSLSSAHVGSMGGIMALKRGECHIAGIHLLDESTGDYNHPYISRYLGDQKIGLVRGVKRIQGIMIAKGNPLGITRMQNLYTDQPTGKALRYVNRQRGSGTRILFDYLLGQEGIQDGALQGYEREEFTHMAVAVQIASDTADAGMGIYSAAKAFHLDFIPICEELYDFIVLESFLQVPMMQEFIKILQSEEFRSILDSLGGYIVEGAGEVIIK